MFANIVAQAHELVIGNFNFLTTVMAHGIIPKSSRLKLPYVSHKANIKIDRVTKFGKRKTKFLSLFEI